MMVFLSFLRLCFFVRACGIYTIARKATLVKKKPSTAHPTSRRVVGSADILSQNQAFFCPAVSKHFPKCSAHGRAVGAYPHKKNDRPIRDGRFGY
jgi:hypothetical protein